MQKKQDRRQENLHKQLAKIPSVEEVLQQEDLQPFIHRYSRKMITPLLRVVLEEERKLIINGNSPSAMPEILQKCSILIQQDCQSFLRPVINATGVILHTNFGRAIIGDKLIAQAVDVIKGFSNLEYDLFDGKRGKRGLFIERMLATFSQSESALILNNNAAAVYLILKTMAKGREVIISRGELVQIGGGFRIPAILEESCAILREVGTTNQTTLQDYEKAINTNTGLILKVHQSNFSLVGFTQEATVKELHLLARKYQLPLVVDLGSGTFLPTEGFQLQHEPTVQDNIRAGADLVCFSGDKLLGGPQAGIICGKREYLNIIRKDPMYRTFRVGKVTMALLQCTMLSYLQGTSMEDLPVWQMISQPYQKIKRRCRNLVKKLREKKVPAFCQDGESVVGGGSLPGKSLPTRLFCLQTSGNIKKLDQKLRLSYPALVGRVQDNLLMFDPRTIEPKYDKLLVDIICSAYQTEERLKIN